MPDIAKTLQTGAAEVRRHYAYANNGYSCPGVCPVCVKQDSDALGHSRGTVVVSLDRPKDEPWQPPF